MAMIAKTWKQTASYYLAVVKDIEIIGEAANQLSSSCRAQAAHLPWQEIIGMRNRLVHAYFEIDVEIVWAVVTQDLPALLPNLERLITPETPDTP